MATAKPRDLIRSARHAGYRVSYLMPRVVDQVIAMLFRRKFTPLATLHKD